MYGDLHCKYKTIVLSLQWEFLHWFDGIFISIQIPVGAHYQLDPEEKCNEL